MFTYSLIVMMTVVVILKVVKKKVGRILAMLKLEGLYDSLCPLF